MSRVAILIADADRASREVLGNVLARTPGIDLGAIDLLEAASDDEALTELQRSSPQAVLVGWSGDGDAALSLCRAIRSAPAGRAVRLALVGSPAPAPGVVRQIERVFAARFFTKPFEMAKLAGYVAETVGAAERAPRARSRTAAPRSGNLADRRLPALLFDIAESGESAVLALRRGQIEKSITLIGGHPVAVRSTAREETLGQFLRDRGAITPEHHHQALRQASATRRRIGEVLVEIGALSQEQLLDALAAQVRFKLVRSLRWPDGSWELAPLETFRAIPGEPIDVIDIVFRGLRETAQLSPLPGHLVRLGGAALRLGERGRRLAPAWGPIYGEALAAAFEAEPVRVEDLFARGASQAEVYALLDALWHSAALETDQLTAQPRGETQEGLGVAELSAQSHRRATEGGSLVDELFDDSELASPSRTGAFPIVVGELEGDSGFVEVPPKPSAAREAVPDELLTAYLQIQGANHYQVVGAHPGDPRPAIEAAVARTQTDLKSRGVLGPGALDLPVAGAIREAFTAARAVLLDEERRAAYDRRLAAGGRADPMRAEVAYARGQQAMRQEQWADAVRELHTAVELAPGEATYRAELGWCHYLKGGRSPRAADQARPHLNRALAIDIDHAAAHEYKGLISAALGTDEVEAISHLQRALDADPHRAAALEALEQILERRGEYRRLERQWRRMIMAASGTPLELELWLRMARLYRNRLDDPDSARIAFEAAAQLAPDDPEIEAIISDLESGTRFHAESLELTARWLESPLDAEPGRRLHQLALESGEFDQAFIAASNLVAVGGADQRAEETFRRYRPRFVQRAQRRLDGELWPLVCDPEDSPHIAQLMALLAPAIQQLAPLTLADLEVGQQHRVGEEQLPAALVRVRAYVAHVLGVAEPKVYVRSDFEQQIHVGGVNPPVLLAGAEILATPERLELAFRLGRAMTYLRPGRALGGSHPAGLLRKVVLAAFYVGHPELEPGGPDADIRTVAESIRALPGTTRRHIQELVEQVRERHRHLNLSEWRRALARTANRVGLLLCGDVPAAVRFARDTGGSQSADDLLRFAIGSGFARLRDAMGFSIQV